MTGHGERHRAVPVAGEPHLQASPGWSIADHLRWFTATVLSLDSSRLILAAACLRSRNSLCREACLLPAPQKHEQNHLGNLIAREDYAKEVQLSPTRTTLLERYRSIFNQLYGEDRDLTLRRGGATCWAC